MLLLEFPLTGEFRLPLLILEWIYIITALEISFIFLVRFRKQEKGLRNFQELGYWSLFFGFSLMWLFYIVADYYSSAEIVSPFLIWKYGSSRILFLNIGYFTLMIAVIFFLYCLEKYSVFLYKRYLFTTIFSICVVLFSILFFIDIRFTQPVTYVFWAVFLFFFVIYLIRFIKKLPIEKGILLFSGFVLMIAGFFLTTDALVEILGFEGRMVGAVMQLMSVIVLSYIFLTLPPFSEFDWQEKIEAVFLVNKAGICLYNKIFIEKKNLMNENLISAAISSINILLQKLTETMERRKDISVIKKKGENVIIYTGKFVSGVLYTSEELNAPKIVLRNLVDKFETLFHNILMSWKGDTSIFDPAEVIVKDLFSS